MQTKTTDTNYNVISLLTTHNNNLQVNGNINNVPYSKFAYLTNITSDVQTQLNNKSNISVSSVAYSTIIGSNSLLPNSSVSGSNYYTFDYLPVGIYMLTSGIAVRAFTYPDTTYITISSSFTSSTHNSNNKIVQLMTSNSNYSWQQFNYCTMISNYSASNTLYVVISKDGGSGTFNTFTNIAWINLMRIA